jgi:hypothetical protein
LHGLVFGHVIPVAEGIHYSRITTREHCKRLDMQHIVRCANSLS